MRFIIKTHLFKNGFGLIDLNLNLKLNLKLRLNRSLYDFRAFNIMPTRLFYNNYFT